MQFKTTIVAASLLLTGGAFFWGYTTDSEQESGESPAYQPRTAEVSDAEPFGAADIRKMMLADLETGEINEEGLRNLREEVVRFAQQQNAADERSTDHYWNELGPDNIGGRARAIVALTETTLLTGGVSGGLWRSETAGNNWVQITGFPNMMVASIAVAGNGDIYVGTGSLFDFAGGEGGSGFRGRGIWYSNDGGVMFTMIEETDPGEFSGSGFSATDALVADPNNPNRVWYGSGDGFGAMENGGLVDVNVSGIPSGAVGDIAVAADGSYMLVGMSSGRVFRSTDNSFTDFETVSGNPNADFVLPQSGMGRVRIDISPDSPEHAYALFATSGGLFGGLYHSGDNGNSWQVEWPGGIDTSTPLPRGQGIYDLALAVQPGNPGVAYVGGIELWRSGFSQQAELAALPFDFVGTDIDVHADIHEIMYTPAGTMYIATDGGIYKSTDQGETYLECNRDFSVTQFYGFDISANSAVLGGTQDNGSLFIPGNGYFLSDQEAVEVNGGDGFDCALSQVTEAVGYEYAFLASSQNGGHTRGTVGPGAINNYGSYYDDNIAELVNEEGELGQFYSVVRLYENMDDPDAQSTVVLVNPYEESVEDSTFTVFTANQNLPFEYTLAEGEVLPYYEELVRPDRLLDEPLSEDPDYFWLEPQAAQPQLECITDSIYDGIDSMIVDIVPILDSIFVEDWNEWVYQEIGLDTLYETFDVYDVVETCDTMYFHAGDTLTDIPGQIKVVDPYTTLTILGFNGSNGLWMSRDALNFNTTPRWIRLDNAPSGTGVKAVEFTVNVEPEAGNHLFVSGWNGKLIRYDGIDDIYAQEDVPSNFGTEILSTGAAVTGISVDPNDPNHVVVTIGGYGVSTGGKVRETFNALDANPTWSNIWIATGDMAKMPCYDVVIDKMDESGQTMVLGTEYGVFATDNGGDDWTMVNTNMGTGTDVISAPVHDVKQQWRESGNYSSVSNEGAIYVATHGRGIFRSDLFLGSEDIISEEATTNAPELLVYPNPATTGAVSWQTDAMRGDFRMEMFDLNGRVVRQEWVRGYAGEARNVNVNGLNAGTYIVRISNNRGHVMSKLMIR